MGDNNFRSTVESLFKGMDTVVSSKTVVGDAIKVGDTIILPLVDVSFAVGAGTFQENQKDKGMGGLGGKMTPCAVLVIQGGKTRLVNIKHQDTITKILDMVPDVIDRFAGEKGEKGGNITEEDVVDILNKDAEEVESKETESEEKKEV
ncbi:MAG: GerW family sporulation protein [Lachnospiraceae bacterium]